MRQLEALLADRVKRDGLREAERQTKLNFAHITAPTNYPSSPKHAAFVSTQWGNVGSWNASPSEDVNKSKEVSLDVLGQGSTDQKLDILGTPRCVWCPMKVVVSASTQHNSTIMPPHYQHATIPARYQHTMNRLPYHHAINTLPTCHTSTLRRYEPTTNPALVTIPAHYHTTILLTSCGCSSVPIVSWYGCGRCL